jgi:hypothetical protein
MRIEGIRVIDDASFAALWLMRRKLFRGSRKKQEGAGACGFKGLALVFC